MMKDKADYSLYLVTDSTKPILGDRDLVHVVEQALLGASIHSIQHIGLWPYIPISLGC